MSNDELIMRQSEYAWWCTQYISTHNKEKTSAKVMKNLIQKFINLVLYSNLWIALCAVAMVVQTELVLLQQLRWSAYAAFVFSATLFTYALHRIVGLQQVAAFRDKGRFLVISNFKYHIVIYAVVAGGASLYFFLQMAWWAQLALVIPALLSLGYVLPIFGKHRRLRDFNFIKIFLIALVWSWVSVLIPAIDCGQAFSVPLLVMMLERSLFIFAITLPFDIRDWTIDQHTKVRTIPRLLGQQRTKQLAYLNIVVMLAAVQFNIASGWYPAPILWAFGLSALVTAGFIYATSEQRHDYFYTAGVDGMMILQWLLVYLCYV